MIKHYCDICGKQILNDSNQDYTTSYEGKKYRVSFSVESLPTTKSIEACMECILKALKALKGD